MAGDLFSLFLDEAECLIQLTVSDLEIPGVDHREQFRGIQAEMRVRSLGHKGADIPQTAGSETGAGAVGCAEIEGNADNGYVRLAGARGRQFQKGPVPGISGVSHG